MQNKILIYFFNIKISEQTLKFSDIVVNKKEIVVPDKFKHSDDGSKYFIGYLHADDVIRPLCIILPQMSGYKNTLIMVEKICHLKLKMKVYILNTLKSGIKLKSH